MKAAGLPVSAGHKEYHLEKVRDVQIILYDKLKLPALGIPMLENGKPSTNEKV